MLIDTVKLTIRAGNGGHGASTFRRNAQTAKGGPDGGDGGNGGNIYFIGSHNINDLREFRYTKKVVAQNGTNGLRQKKFGKNAEHITVPLPLGTRVTDLATREVFEITDTKTPILMAQGGRGGRGNVMFKSATNQTPLHGEAGTEGKVRQLLLELRLIATVGLVGLPNAGKSSLLTVLTNATPAIGDYPFTTLDPTIGMLKEYPIADLPGLIEGASEGKGLGIRFLKHVEKTKILLHCIDSTDPNPEASYAVVRQEFKLFNPELSEKPEYIVLTKADLSDSAALKKLRARFTAMGKEVFVVSTYEPKLIDALKKTLLDLLDGTKPTV